MSTENKTNAPRDAFEYLVSELGKPKVHAIEESISTVMSSGTGATCIALPGDSLETFHPVFTLAHHFRSADSYVAGYTSNTFRGDHLSIPGFSEEGGLGVIEISFHKGHAFISLLTFEDKPSDQIEAAAWSKKYEAAYQIVVEQETR